MVAEEERGLKIGAKLQQFMQIYIIYYQCILRVEPLAENYGRVLVS